MEEIDLNDPELTSMRLRGLSPEHTYRLYIWARTQVGRGQVYEIEETTLPDGRKYANPRNNVCVYVCVCVRVRARAYVCVHACMGMCVCMYVGPMYVWMDGWMDGWMGG